MSAAEATELEESFDTDTQRSYRHLRRIASGGMGTVDLVVRKEGRFRRLLALKRLRSAHREETDLKAMFLEEARLSGLLRHPNVVSVFDVGEDEAGPFLVMDYVDGMSLAAVVRAFSAQLPASVCVEVAMLAARGLHAAHELLDEDGQPLELVHRDVSPQNVLIGYDGTVQVSDFGIAKALGQTTKTSTGILKGKLGYMAPEVLLFEPLDRRADIFALGIVLFEMLARRRLYGKNGEQPAGWRILHEAPPDIGLEREDLTPDLVELLLSMLAKSPDFRPASAREVERRLHDVREDLRLQSPDFIDLADFMRSEFATKASISRREVSALMKAAAEAPPPAPLGRPQPPKRAWLAPALALGVLVAGGAWWARAPEPSATQAPPRNALPESEPSAPPQPVPVAPVASDGPAGQAANATPMERTEASRRRARMRPSMREPEPTGEASALPVRSDAMRPRAMHASPMETTSAPSMEPEAAMEPASRNVEDALRQNGIEPW
ncbi:MAG: protein kinase [Myxococcota bacterium]